MELDRNSEILTYALQIRRSAAELIQHINDLKVGQPHITLCHLFRWLLKEAELCTTPNESNFKEYLRRTFSSINLITLDIRS